MSFRIAPRMQDVERTLIRQIFDSAPPEAINLGLGQPDLPTPAVASIGGIAGIAQGRTGYSATAGDIELRARIAEAYRPFATGPENVLVTVGSQEAMFIICLTLAQSGDEILYPDPGYPAYPVVARLVGASAVAYPLRAERKFRLDPQDIAERLTERTRAVILCAPSNPTGACIDERDLEQTVSVLAQRGVPWISDEIYSAFCYDRAFVSPAVAAPKGGVVVSSLSKDAAMAGWRVGWIVGPADLVRRLTAAHQYAVTCAPSVSQAAAMAALSAPGRAARQDYVARFARRRLAAADELRKIPGLDVHPPDGAFYFFVDVSRHGDSLALARRILDRRRVITIPGEAFGKRGAGFLRISFAAPEERLREGIARIGRELAGTD